jgi:hypothetical protein
MKTSVLALILTAANAIAASLAIPANARAKVD